MLGHKRNREEEKCEENNLFNKTTSIQKKNFYPNFLMKLYQILETPDLSSIIEWGENGKFFRVKNITDFTEKVLPKFFKHNNFASFVRQLNMYDFHKKRTYNNENIFQHKNFIRGQKNLIKTIKRKSAQNSNLNVNNKSEGQELIENYQKNITSKKLTKLNLEKIILNFGKQLELSNERQKNLEIKYEELEKKCEAYYVQNQNLMQEITSRSDWTKKLETIIYLIFDYMKSKMIKNETAQLRSSIFSGNNEVNYITQYADKNGYKPTKVQSDSNKINTNFYKSYNENGYESNFLKNLVNNLFDYLADQKSKEIALHVKDEMYRLVKDKEKLLALEDVDNSQSKLFNIDKNFTINGNKESDKKINQVDLNDENFKKIFDEYSYKNHNPINTLKKDYKSINNTNSTPIFRNQRESDKKNQGMYLAFSTQENNPVDINQIQSLNTEKLNIKQAMNSTINYNEAANDIFENTNINEYPTSYSDKNIIVNMDDINNQIQNTNEKQIIHLNENINNIGMDNDLYKKEDYTNLNSALNEEDKSIFMKVLKSPNPFEDYSFGNNTNLFDSPNAMERNIYKLSNETNGKMNLNFDLNRNSSLDYIDIFKSSLGRDNFEGKKPLKENNLYCDDSFFSISSNDKKSKAFTEPIYNSRNSKDAELLNPFKTFN